MIRPTFARVAGRIARVVPLWDFGTPDWLSDRGDLWADPSLFKPEVGEMVFGHMFGCADLPTRHFGALAGQRLNPHGCRARCAQVVPNCPSASMICQVVRQSVT